MDAKAKALTAALLKLNGASIGSIDSETVVTLKGGKKNPMQGRITKVAENANVMFFCNSKSNAYENMVNRRLTAEGKDPSNFVLGPRVWGQRINDTPFIEHKGEMYVEVVYLRAPKIVRYFFDGVAIAKAAIFGLEEDKKEGEQGGLENKVIIRTFKLSSISKIRMGDMSFGV